MTIHPDPATHPVAGIQQQQRHNHAFAHAKRQALTTKADKSSVGAWDIRVRPVCALLNDLCDSYYTTSSCSGRCFVYTGEGNKQQQQRDFTRWAVSHDPVDGTTYWETEALPIVSTSNASEDIWFRFEPFLLHVACRSWTAARRLVDATRPIFKNVGVTAGSAQRYIVAIWGDEGLEMPLVVQGERVHTMEVCRGWLTRTVNTKFERNQRKLDAFTEAIRELVAKVGVDGGLDTEDCDGPRSIPRSYDIIGDIAVLHTLHGSDEDSVAKNILSRHSSTVNIVALRTTTLLGPDRTAEIRILAGPNRTVTTHREYGVACIVDVAATFFSPRMAAERFRLCQRVLDQQNITSSRHAGENVLVLFGGVGMEALLLAFHTPVQSVTVVDQNLVAMECAARGVRQLQRKHPTAAAKLRLVTADVMQRENEENGNCDGGVEEEQEQPHDDWYSTTYDRILVPRPKLSCEKEDQALKESIWKRVVALADPVRCHVHWYDFCPPHEAPQTHWMEQQMIGSNSGRAVRVEHVARVGSVAHRQNRVCIDMVLASRTEPTCS